MPNICYLFCQKGNTKKLCIGFRKAILKVLVKFLQKLGKALFPKDSLVVDQIRLPHTARQAEQGQLVLLG